MNTRLITNLRQRWALCLAGLLVGASSLPAQNVSFTSNPIGSFNLPLAGASDNYTSLPLHRPVAIAAAVQSVSLSGNSTVITLAAPTMLTPSQFVYVAGTQPNTYFVQFMTGAKEGLFYTVTANDATTITVNSNGDTSLPQAVVSADQIDVIPYWTLNTTFPGGQGLYPSNSTSSPQSLVMLPNLTTPGINLPVAASYYYYTGNGGPAWKKVGDSSANQYPDVVLSPDTYFIVRHPLGTANTTLLVLGAVAMSKETAIVGTLKAMTRQDNAVSMPVPEDIPLNLSNLYPGVMSGSPNFAPQDTLLIFSPSVIKQNKPATAVYFYYTGSLFGGAGWRKTGDPTTNRNTDVIAAGQGYIIRLGSRPAPMSFIWQYLPSYLQ